ncbi:ribonuclease Z [Halobacillus karajensis]|uniref:Ribonuclease Z n=1 Tax=Halobacillus karajensis TaxID=195088 RepID=A0A024P675_9BACI|nr:ribonuclease Z [Halobacillus karajensis]CDQ17857.1 Ribonuclease Z [Halobacillus karajensis]CDQ24263.1 Ribonuclease Z [Halobacillus karajensis]CDQ29488.1 Ribonuclease Z [Halobacillus karajensis]
MELFFLGTGSGVPSKERNVSSLVLRLLEERGTTWVFDCGEGTQQQILNTNIRPRRIEAIFITHLHGDHIYGLPGLLSSRSFQGGESPVTVYGPRGLKEYIDISLQLSGTNLRYPLYVEEVQEGELFEDEQFVVEAVKLEHGLESYGYILKEKDKLGELQPEKLKELGIQPGPLYQTIKSQPQTKLEDGRIIHRNDVLGPPKRGRKIAIFGDTRYLPELVNFLEGADLLVHEATFAGGEEDMARDYYHSTVKQAATLAKKAGVGELILNHLSSRYQGDAVEQLSEEAKNIFPNTIIAYDFYRHQVKRS